MFEYLGMRDPFEDMEASDRSEFVETAREGRLEGVGDLIDERYALDPTVLLLWPNPNGTSFVALYTSHTPSLATKPSGKG